MNPDVFRGPWGGRRCRDSLVQTTRNCTCDPGQCVANDNYLNDVKDMISHCLPKGHIAAMFAESIQGIGGTVQFPKGYIKGVYDLVKANNGLFISDEVYRLFKVFFLKVIMFRSFCR